MRKHRAIVLLVAFVLGGIISPLSHYAYMAAGGMASSLESEAFDQTGPSAGHASHEMHGHVAITDGPSVGETPPLQTYCKYSDLFATFAAAFSHLDAVPAPELVSASVSVEPVGVETQFVGTSRSRGPPQVS